MIFAKNLVKNYKHIKALDDVSLLVESREVCGVIGPNGAGKTTLFKIICGLITPDSGSFSINSKKSKPIGAIIEKPVFYNYLSAHQNLNVLSKVHGKSLSKNETKVLLETVGLSSKRKDQVKNFSLGMKQRLGIAIALLGDPDCLILDEPYLGLDPPGMFSLGILITQLAKDRGLAILQSSHLIDEISRSSDTLHVIQQGQIVDSGKTNAVLSNSTKQFKLCGKHFEKSSTIQEMDLDLDRDCLLLNLKPEQAPAFLKRVVIEGVEVTFFGPETDIDGLYRER